MGAATETLRTSFPVPHSPLLFPFWTKHAASLEQLKEKRLLLALVGLHLQQTLLFSRAREDWVKKNANQDRRFNWVS